LVEVFSGVLSGAAVGPQVGPMYKKNVEAKQNVGHFLCLLDIEAFMDVESFKERIDASIDAIKSCKKMPGVTEILVPGERSFRTAVENSSMGIPIDDATCEELKILCQQYGVPFTLKRMDSAG
jgi:LDH2 family malate/lactate/ureidoglycolate dehydrogenase